jgi:hypothetical protein
MYFIQKQFGFGRVFKIIRSDHIPHWRYSVETLSEALKMIELLNGNLILQKRQLELSNL